MARQARIGFGSAEHVVDGTTLEDARKKERARIARRLSRGLDKEETEVVNDAFLSQRENEKAILKKLVGVWATAVKPGLDQMTEAMDIRKDIDDAGDCWMATHAELGYLKEALAKIPADLAETWLEYVDLIHQLKKPEYKTASEGIPADDEVEGEGKADTAEE